MTLFVTMCQVIGRLIRGGCKARVHFCDAKFAPNTAYIQFAIDMELEHKRIKEVDIKKIYTI